MSEADDEFRVRLGRMGNRKARRPSSYLRRVRVAAEKTGAARSERRSAFTGSRIGRGRAEGAASAARRRSAGQRRVIVKARLVRIKGAEPGAMRTHLRYIQRDGVTREGTPGELYDAGSDQADGKAFAERAISDRHQFRFIVAPEDSAELADLKPFVRDLMRQVEADLGTRLDWVAADHFNTGHPHTHIVVRGADERGQDLVIARDYIAHGMRARASDLMTRELGPETEIEIVRKLEQEVGAERFTRLDRAILRDAEDVQLVPAARPGGDPRHHAMRMGRLRTLERMGLAAETTSGVWRLDSDMELTLRRMGERGDIMRTMQRELTATGRQCAAVDCVIFDPNRDGNRIVGRVVSEGFSDELSEHRYLIAEGIDGRTHYVELGARRAVDEPLVRDTIIEVRPRGRAGETIDRAIASIAAANDGVYSADLHREADRRASSEYVATHVRRLEAMRRAGLVERASDGHWQVGSDFLERADRFEAASRAKRPVRVVMLSWQKLEALPEATGATWLDRRLIEDGSPAMAKTGFGLEVEDALRTRRQWLVEQGLAREQGGRTVFARDLLKVLERRELANVGERISTETGLAHAEINRGGIVSGIYRRSLTLNSGRYALIENAREFALVPWRPVLERALGQVVTGRFGGEGISWSIGQKRGLGL